GAAALREHRAGDPAGVGAGVADRQVLGSVGDTELVALDASPPRADVGARRADRRGDVLEVLLGKGERDLLHQGDGLEVVEVHLPVARDERCPCHDRQPSRTAMPGSSLPSRYSREAPPPVEMCEKRSSPSPSDRTAAAESPPPTTLNAPLPVASMIASATPFVPAAKFSNSNTPIGPFQTTVFAEPRSEAKRCTDSGPMSRPIHPSGMESAATVCDCASATNLSATTTSCGMWMTSPKRSSSCLQVSIIDSSSSEVP